MNYVLIDSLNTFFRAKYIATKGSDSWTKVGFALHLTLSSIAKVYREQKADHVILCLDGGSWRKEIYAPYKANRAETRNARTEIQVDEDELFFEAYNDMIEFFVTRTNCTVLGERKVEGDDFIARWTQTHPDDKHTIISSDTDFDQLLATNINRYNGITDELISLEGIFDNKGKPVMDHKTKLPKVVDDPAWILFLKCFRGDKSDHIFSAYPGVRVKGSKNKIGLKEAFDDRNDKGYAWNNIMLQRWVDHNEIEHRVMDDYERNVNLIDLTKQPQYIIDAMDKVITDAYDKPIAKQVGTYLLKFCGKYELAQIAKFPDRFAEYMNAGLPKWRLRENER